MNPDSFIDQRRLNRPDIFSGLGYLLHAVEGVGVDVEEVGGAACAFDAAGAAWCVGEGTYGVIGDGIIRTNGYSATAYQVSAPYKY